MDNSETQVSLNTLGKSKTRKKIKEKRKRKYQTILERNYKPSQTEQLQNCISPITELLCEGIANFHQQNMAPDCS